jgi:hypothetical protein
LDLNSAAVPTTRLPLTDLFVKDVAFSPHTDAAQIISTKPEDRTSKDADATTHLTAAALMAKPQLKDTKRKVADANTLLMAAVQMKLHQPLARSTQAAPATLTNSDAVLMESPLPLDLTTKDVTALTANSSAAQTTSHQLKDLMVKVALAQQVCMDAALMDQPKLKDQTLMAAKKRFLIHLRKLAVSLATWVTAAKTTLSSTSSTLNTAAAVASGMADAEETRTDLTPKASARTLALSQLEKILANYQRFTDHVLDTTQCGTMTVTGTLALSSSTEDALEMLTDSRNLRIARLNAWWMIRFVSLSFLSMLKS